MKEKPMSVTQPALVGMETAPGCTRDFCYLRDQEPLSASAFNRALELRDRIGGLIKGRETFLRKTGRDPAVHMPRGNWDLGNDVYTGHWALMRGDYEVVNHLRLFSQVFTGFQLLSLSHDHHSVNVIPTAVPDDADERFAALAATPGEGVEGYLESVNYLPEELHISPPAMFGEVGWLYDGKILNRDTFGYLERMVLLAESGKLWELRNRDRSGWRPRILEIGSGYGGLAYHIKKLIPQARYYCVDLPESLLFSSIYLSTLFEHEDNLLVTPDNLSALRADSPGFTFLPNYLFDDCCDAGLSFDLIINTLSMSEMVEAQVHYYCQGIVRLLAQDGVFFDQNQDNRSVGFIDAKQHIARCLPFCLPLRSPVRPLTRGMAHLWATNRFRPYLWLASHEYLPGPKTMVQRVRSLGGRVLRKLGMR
jgi:SAM-dependent methyltransferase